MSALEKVINTLKSTGHYRDREQALSFIRPRFDNSPYHFAKQFGVLVDNSAEDFAIEFMTEYNRTFGLTY